MSVPPAELDTEEQIHRVTHLVSEVSHLGIEDDHTRVVTAGMEASTEPKIPE